ncbi:hypothetical protein RhiirA1_405564, partial [Rhizophagus irregularis]
MENNKNLTDLNINHPISKYPIECVDKIFETVSEGYDQFEVIGKTPKVLQSGVHDKSFYQAMWKNLKEYGIWQGEIWNRRKTGDLYPESLTIMEIKDSKGEVTNYCGIFTDLSERKIVENELEKRALTDSLTE